jgi:hypothetical protein
MPLGTRSSISSTCFPVGMLWLSMKSIDVVGVIANMRLRVPPPALCLITNHCRRICSSSKCLVMSLILSRLQEDSHAPSLSPTGAADNLHCIVCNGIPFDRYRLMTTTEKPSTLRRTLALTRQLLQSTLEIKADGVDAILCSPFFNYPGCRDAASRDERQNDLMYCHECVSRADPVFQRYTYLEQVTRAGVASGYVISGSQLTPKAEDECTDIETSDTHAHM